MLTVDVPIYLRIGNQACKQLGTASIALDSEDLDVAAELAAVLREAADRLAPLS